jgi:hypothetical protein
VGLLRSFAAMGRWFFDNRLLDGLTAGDAGAVANDLCYMMG